MAAVLCLIFAASSAAWFALDHSWPYWDAAGHLADAIQYRAIWHKMNPFSIHWIHSFLTESYYYPVTVHAFNGLLKLWLGNGRWVDGLSLIMFGVVLNGSVFVLTRMLFRDTVAAALSVVLVNCYPVVAGFSHVPMLDFPYLALYSLSVLGLIWWQGKPNMARAVLAGIAMALAATSKQGASLYLVMPCLVLWLHLAWKKRLGPLLQLSIAGLMVAAALLLWIVPNYSAIQALFKEYSGVLSHGKTAAEILVSNLCSYTISLGAMLSPLLLGLLIAACFRATRDVYTKLWIPLTGSITGTVLLSAAPYGNSEARYTIAVVLPAAVISGVFLSKIMRSGSLWKKSAALFALGLAVVQFVLLNFSPYPIPLGDKPARLLQAASGASCGDSTWRINTSPTPPGDNWCQDWIVDTINKAGNQECWVNLMPNTSEINVRTLSLAVFYHGGLMKPTTARAWTLRGDKVPDLSGPIDKLWSQWFVIKTGSQGQYFFDEQSRNNYEHAIHQVENSPSYRLFAKHPLPDNSELRLYCVSSWLKAHARISSRTTESSRSLSR